MPRKPRKSRDPHPVFFHRFSDRADAYLAAMDVGEGPLLEVCVPHKGRSKGDFVSVLISLADLQAIGTGITALAEQLLDRGYKAVVKSRKKHDW